MPVTVIGTITHHQGVDTQVNIQAIGTALDAEHGQLYLPNNVKEAYIGMYDGTLLRFASASSWIVSDGTNTLGVPTGNTLQILGEKKIITRIDSGALKVSIDTTGAADGQILTYTTGGLTWTSTSPGFITAIGDTTTLDLSMTGSTLSGVVKVDSSGDNNISITANGLYAKKYTIAPGSSNYMSIDANNQISVSQLVVIDVVTDNTSTTLAAAISAGSTVGMNEGDVLILSNATGGSQAWIHNGGSTGTATDFSQLNVGISDSQVKSLFSAQTPLVYNNSTGQFSLYNLSGYGSAGQLLRTNGSQLEYWTPNFLTQAYTTVRNSSDTPVTQRTTMRFDSGLTVNDVGGITAIGVDATLLALANFNTNGILVQTASDTFTGRTIAGTVDRVTVSNGNGVSGNPTIDIAPTYIGQSSITTVGTISTGTWNGTVIGMQYGGFGKAMTDPNANKLLYWNDTTNQFDYLGLDSTLSITGGNLSVTGGVDTNSWYTVNTATKNNDITSTIYRTGNIVIGNAATGYTSNYALEVWGAIASMSVPVSGGGLILTSPNGTRYKFTVSDTGVLNRTTL